MNNNESKNFLSFKVREIEVIVMRNFSGTFLLAAERVEKKRKEKEKREKEKKKEKVFSVGRTV